MEGGKLRLLQCAVGGLEAEKDEGEKIEEGREEGRRDINAITLFAA